jgi:hypothetical protein
LLRQQLARARGALREAKVSWHAFEPEVSRKKADEAFTTAMKLKDALQQKIGY